jgi:OOP family OmpA-OmpF porin
MKRNHLKLVLLIAGLVAVMGWSGQQAVCHGAADLDQKVKSGEYIKKIDNFMVIMDASDTLTKKYKEDMRFKLEKNVVTLMNQTIPDLDIMGALRIFSDKGNIDPWKPTELVYGLTKYSEAGFKEGLDKVKTAEGNSPLDLAIIAASKDLEGANGKIAVIIFSDGDKIPQKPVIAAAEGMKKQYGDRVCLYTVLVGDSQAGKDLLDKVAQAGQCGFATTADEINSEAAMSDFVQKVFLVQQPDSDGDGVRDHLDKCPDTPKGVKVDEVGCPIDSDGDGVPDYLDKCPDTPKGVEVDEVGCPLDSEGVGVRDYLVMCPVTPKGA